MIARLAQSFLAHRASSQQASSNLFYAADTDTTASLAAGVLPAVLEFIESPVQQMKRAGLGLLSMGLGR